MSKPAEDTGLHASGLDMDVTNDDVWATQALLIEADMISRIGKPGIYELVLIRVAASQAAGLAFAHMQLQTTGQPDVAMAEYAMLTKKLGHTLWTIGATEKLVGSGAMGVLQLAHRTLNERLEATPAAGSA